MARAKITAKGQATIPKEVREHLQVHEGDQLEFIVLDSGSVMVQPAYRGVTELRGVLKDLVKKPVSLAEMRAAVLRKHNRVP
jgi:antitoxin PrlF